MCASATATLAGRPTSTSAAAMEHGHRRHLSRLRHDRLSRDRRGGHACRLLPGRIDAEMRSRCEDGTRSWCRRTASFPPASQRTLAFDEDDDEISGCSCTSAPSQGALGWWALVCLGVVSVARRKASVRIHEADAHGLGLAPGYARVLIEVGHASLGQDLLVEPGVEGRGSGRLHEQRDGRIGQDLWCSPLVVGPHAEVDGGGGANAVTGHSA